MDKLPPPRSYVVQRILEIVRVLRDDSARHVQVLEELMAFLQQPELSELESMRSVWMPPSGEGMIEPIQTALNIRKIEPAQTKPSDIVTLLCNLGLRRFYRRYLRRYAITRGFVIWIWRNGYPIYANLSVYLLNIKAKRWRPLIKLSDFARRMEVPTYKLADSSVVEIATPIVLPSYDQSYLVSPHDQYSFPEIYVATIKNAMTYGGTNLILADGEVICHDLHDFERDYTSEELHGRALIDPKSSRISWLLHDKTPEPIPVAATFVDACASNYAHWMTEVLPRIVMFCAEERFNGIPIVVNDGLHKNIMESLFLVVGNEREIITLPIGRALAVGVLYFTSVTGYVPFGRRNKKLSGHSHGIFSPHALALVRKHMNAFHENAERETWPEKIFIRRKSAARKVTNAAELESLMVSRGYVIVEPEGLTFSQQVQLFSNANTIVAPTGAALASAVFCKPGTKVAILMAKHTDMIYRYWMEVFTPNEIKVSYLLCTIVGNQGLGLHGDYLVDTMNIVDLLEALENK